MALISKWKELASWMKRRWVAKNKGFQKQGWEFWVCAQGVHKLQNRFGRKIRSGFYWRNGFYALKWRKRDINFLKPVNYFATSYQKLPKNLRLRKKPETKVVEYEKLNNFVESDFETGSLVCALQPVIDSYVNIRDREKSLKQKL